jgi:hypothetical protein
MEALSEDCNFYTGTFTATMLKFGFQTDKQVGRERPRSATERSGNTRHCEDAVALPISAGRNNSLVYSLTRGPDTHRTFN